MADTSQSQSSSKKSGKSLKQKRAEKKAAAASKDIRTVIAPRPGQDRGATRQVRRRCCSRRDRLTGRRGKYRKSAKLEPCRGEHARRLRRLGK